MRRGVCLLPLLVAALACATRPSARSTEPVVRDGTTKERAVQILESTDAAGVAAERSWIAMTYPGARRVRSGVFADGERRYNEVVIRLPDGTEKTLYFDITAYYGF